MVNLRLFAYGTERQTVDFLVCCEWISCELDTYVTQYTGIVVVIVAAVFGARTTFNLLLRSVGAGLAAEDDAAPVARSAATGCLLGCEYNRLCLRTLGYELSATLSYEGSLGVLVALDYGSRFDGQFSAVGDVYPTF